MRTASLYCLLVVAGNLLTGAQARAVLVLDEQFDDDAAFVRAQFGGGTTLFFENGSDAYWGLHDPGGTNDDFGDEGIGPATGVPSYTGFTNPYLVGEDLDAIGYNVAVSLTWSGLDISGYTGFTFSGDFAASNGGTTDYWESDDWIRMQYRVDSSDPADYENLLWFSEDGGELSLDDDFNGTGQDGFNELNVFAQHFEKTITVSGNTLDIRIFMDSDDVDEEFAFDNFQINGVPEASQILCLSVVGLGMIWFNGRPRRDGGPAN